MVLLILGLSTGYISLDRDYTGHLEIDKLNERIEFPYAFKNEQWGLSGSLLIVERNLAFSMKMLKGNEIADLDSISLALSFDTKLIELGYAFEFSRFIFSLTGGGGYSSLALKAINESETIDFPTSLLSPEGSINYKSSTYVLSVSAGIMLAISDYLGVGVFGGYVHGLRTPDIVLDGVEDVEVQNAPRMPLNQWYVKFSLGMGDFVNL